MRAKRKEEREMREDSRKDGRQRVEIEIEGKERRDREGREREQDRKKRRRHEIRICRSYSSGD